MSIIRIQIYWMIFKCSLKNKIHNITLNTIHSTQIADIIQTGHKVEANEYHNVQSNVGLANNVILAKSLNLNFSISILKIHFLK